MLEGYVHPDFADVARRLRREIAGAQRRYGAGGAAVCIWHRGEVVFDCWGGTRDEEGHAWEPDTLAISFSTTKGVASTLLHVFADRGCVDYDAPVREYWPEFAAAGKERITVRQVLCHQAGLYHIRDMVEDASEMLDWERMTGALAASTPRHEPGTAHGYHAFTFGWLVGEIVQRVAGKPFREVLEAELAGPLGLDGLYVGVPADQMHRRARLVPVPGRHQRRQPERMRRVGRALNRALRVTRVPFDLAESAAALLPAGFEKLDFNSEAFAAASIPAANGAFSARSLAKLYAVLAAGGTLGDVRLVSGATLAEMGRVHQRGPDRVIPFPLGWRLGYHGAPTLRPRVRAGFGHSGYGGSGAWADPERNLAVGFVLNSGAGTPLGDLRIVHISNAAARCADRR